MLTAFPSHTYAARQAAVVKRMAAQGVDALIVNFPDNINYLTGFDSLGYLWYLALVLSADAPSARSSASSAIRIARLYDIAAEDQVEIVARELKRLKLDRGRIAIEPHAFTFTVAQHTRLKALLPDATLVDGSLLVAEERLIKAPDEIAFQRQAGDFAEAGLRAGLAELRPGVT